MGRPIYTKPYFDEIDNESFPKGYRVPKFHLFLGEDIRESTIEHVAHFTCCLPKVGGLVIGGTCYYAGLC